VYIRHVDEQSTVVLLTTRACVLLALLLCRCHYENIVQVVDVLTITVQPYRKHAAESQVTRVTCKRKAEEDVGSRLSKARSTPATKSKQHCCLYRQLACYRVECCISNIVASTCCLVADL